MTYTIAVLPGDGVGPDVVNEGIKIVDAVSSLFGHKFHLVYGELGGSAIDSHGQSLPEHTLKICSESDAIILGAVGGPKWDDPSLNVRPEDGLLKLRKELNLYANLRPVKALPSTINASPIKADLLTSVDMMIVRELTGGLYFGLPKERWQGSDGRHGVDTMAYSETEIKRVLKVGFELAGSRNFHLTSVDKSNVLETSRLWRLIADEMKMDYPDVVLEHMLVDNAAMQLIRNPSKFDVIVTENTFGDILTDEASVLAGSLGMLPSASLAGTPKVSNESHFTLGLYEPIHGSAPDIAGQDIANPVATILSIALMMELSFGLKQESGAINRAVESVLADGYATPDIRSENSIIIGTQEMGSLVADRIR